MDPDMTDANLRALAAAVGLTLPPETVGGVQANFALLAQLARLVGEAPLDDSADEPAVGFVPR